jgi:hypothetical protein
MEVVVLTCKRCASWLLLTALLMAASWAMAKDQQAMVVKVHGSAQLAMGKGKPHNVEIGETIPDGATLKTGPPSSALCSAMAAACGCGRTPS